MGGKGSGRKPGMSPKKGSGFLSGLGKAAKMIGHGAAFLLAPKYGTYGKQQRAKHAKAIKDIGNSFFKVTNKKKK